MIVWSVNFRSPSNRRYPFYETMKIDAPTEEEALKILAEKFTESLIGRHPIVVDDGKTIPLKDDFSFYVDEDMCPPCVAMNIHDHKHVIATVEPFPVPKPVDFAIEMALAVNNAWLREYKDNKNDPDFETMSYISSVRSREWNKKFGAKYGFESTEEEE